MGSKNLDGVLIKKPHIVQRYTEEQLLDCVAIIEEVILNF